MFKILVLKNNKKNIKCNIWRVAIRPSYIWDARFLMVNLFPLKKIERIFERNREVEQSYFYLH
jgi:hypothetical protein